MHIKTVLETSLLYNKNHDDAIEFLKRKLNMYDIKLHYTWDMIV